jgi:hypothetical protein
MRKLSLQRRLVLAIVLGMACGLASYLRLRESDLLAADLTWAWRGARALLAGQNPYQVIQPTGANPFDAPLFYPLPALFVFVPLAWLPAPVAAGVFMAISTALLVFGLTRDGYGRLPLLASVPFLNSVIWPQWAPLIAAAALLPALMPLVLAKPSIGLAAFAARGTWRSGLICAAVLGFSVLVLPSWPLDWLAAIRRHGGLVPLLYLPGPLVLVALVRWRDWRGRLLAMLAIVPQISYDSLLAWLVPQTFRQSAALTLLSWCAVFTWGPANRAGIVSESLSWVSAWIYLPACAMLLAPDIARLARRFRRVPAGTAEAVLSSGPDDRAPDL